MFLILVVCSFVLILCLEPSLSRTRIYKECKILWKLIKRWNTLKTLLTSELDLLDATFTVSESALI